MDRLITFERITIEPPLKAIYRRLGYRKGLTQIRPDEARALGDGIEQARALITLKGAARRLPILSKDTRQIRLPGGHALESAQLAALLADSREVILLGATAGPAVSSVSPRAHRSLAVKTTACHHSRGTSRSTVTASPARIRPPAVTRANRPSRGIMQSPVCS